MSISLCFFKGLGVFFLVAHLETSLGSARFGAAQPNLFFPLLFGGYKNITKWIIYHVFDRLIFQNSKREHLG